MIYVNVSQNKKLHLYINKKTKYEKAIDIKYKISVANHAMIFIGYDKNSNNQITKWLVENSHGSDVLPWRPEHSGDEAVQKPCVRCFKFPMFKRVVISGPRPSFIKSVSENRDPDKRD